MKIRVKAYWTERTEYTAQIEFTEEEFKSLSYNEIKEKIESDAGYITDIEVHPDYDSFIMWRGETEEED